MLDIDCLSAGPTSLWARLLALLFGFMFVIACVLFAVVRG
jgi:hypothetical protein